ncbi:MAG: hypothetical protein E6K78_02925 [Candidatus Eisenbacteria bacterium]|uniref:Glycosyl hydrolases family 39 N-terminal catalytic domain-containing protein n=1 Tax=Eiseniibacteriota bacterium TaxID=2212470 RepID=A0A538TWF3_UNCEI|nr:MAG: hypothetical protein E6K78_02925 [Candidatus Eisenbacteria bacterium]
MRRTGSGTAPAMAMVVLLALLSAGPPDSSMPALSRLSDSRWLGGGHPTSSRSPGRVDPPPDAVVPETYFGMHIHRAVPQSGELTTTAWPVVRFGAWRLWDAHVAWASLEPKRGVWDFSLLDRYVALAESAQVEVLLPLGLSPAWAAARPKEASAYHPGNASEPADMEAWDKYVRTVVSRYRGRIKAYEIWNEPNLPQFFSGHVEEMVRLAQTAYVRIKRLDAGAVVVSPSATGRPGVAWLESYLDAGGGRWADVIGFHFYVGQNDSPEDMAALVPRVREVVDAHGFRARPIWNTETGWRLEGQQPAPVARYRVQQTAGLDDTLAAAYVARALVLGWAEGLERFYWYSWDNYTMGLVEADGTTLKPAAKAYGTVYKWLIGARVTDVSERLDGTWTVAVRRDKDREAVIVWNPGGVTAYSPPSLWTEAVACNVAGECRPLSGEGTKDVVVGASPIFIERTSR